MLAQSHKETICLYDQNQHLETEDMTGTVSVAIVTRFPDVGSAKKKQFPLVSVFVQFGFSFKQLGVAFLLVSVCVQVTRVTSSVPKLVYPRPSVPVISSRTRRAHIKHVVLHVLHVVVHVLGSYIHHALHAHVEFRILSSTAVHWLRGPASTEALRLYLATHPNISRQSSKIPGEGGWHSQWRPGSN